MSMACQRLFSCIRGIVYFSELCLYVTFIRLKLSISSRLSWIWKGSLKHVNKLYLRPTFHIKVGFIFFDHSTMVSNQRKWFVSHYLQLFYLANDIQNCYPSEMKHICVLLLHVVMHFRVDPLNNRHQIVQNVFCVVHGRIHEVPGKKMK